MRHPFDGIDTPRTGERTPIDMPTTRRSILARALAAAAGIATLLMGRGSSAQGYLDRRRRPPTTFALGEEGGGRVTTFALGEEGGGPVTTRALGEEGGGRVTTYALGEEGGHYPPPPRRRGWWPRPRPWR
jgi:hypothetical protein